MTTLAGWQPSTPPFYAQPVQVESATGGITGAQMPDGRGVLVWPNSGAAKFAVVASPSAFLIDNIVGSGDIGTIVSGDVVRTAVYNIDNEIYATVVTWSGTVTTTKIYQADDPSDPAGGWTAAGTLQNDNTPGLRFGTEQWGAGVPVKLASGRWVLGQGGWEVGFPPGAAASGAFVHAYYSDSGAAGPWIRTLLYGHHLAGFPRTDWMSAQVAVEPATGDIFHSSTATPPNQVTIWRSQDDGATWGQFDASDGVSGGAHRLSFVINNGSDIFAIADNGFYIGDAASGPITSANNGTGGWSDTGENWSAPSMSTDLVTRKALVVGGSVFTFALDQVAKLGAAWFVGFIGQS